MATVVVVRLPILTFPLPAAAQDSDEGLRTGSREEESAGPAGGQGGGA